MNLRITFATMLALVCACAQTSGNDRPLRIRLSNPVTSVGLSGQGEIKAVVVAPYADRRGLRIPVGSLVSGRAEGDRRRLTLTFDSIRIDHVDYPMRARVQEVDNARETVTADGTILALEPLRKRPGKVEVLLLAAAHAHPMALAFVEGSKLTLREVERPSVRYSAGTDLALQLETPPRVTVRHPPRAQEPAPPRVLVEMLQALPSRAVTYQRQVPSDWVNLAFAGTKDELVRAFDSAGWTHADRLSAQADVKTFLALAGHHSYQHAPVSRLAIAGRLPDVVYQKQTNTFARRHHIRIWATDHSWKGRLVWIAAATHDIGIEFSSSSRTFTHRIDSDVDLEREKVVNDLSFAGAVRQMYFVARPDVPAESRNGTGDAVRTDGRLVFLEF